MTRYTLGWRLPYIYNISINLASGPYLPTIIGPSTIKENKSITLTLDDENVYFTNISAVNATVFLQDVNTIIVSNPTGAVQVNVSVAYRVLETITLSGPIVTTFDRGNTFTYGGIVTANYNNGSTAIVTNSATFSGYNLRRTGSQTVTVSYTENSITAQDTYAIQVNAAWTTAWEGTKTCDNKYNASGPWSNYFASTTLGTGKTPKLRITFSTSYVKGRSVQTITYLVGSNSETIEPSSPYTIETTAQDYNLIGIKLYDPGNSFTNTPSSTIIAQLVQEWNWDTLSNVEFSLRPDGSGTQLAGNYEVSITVTKIEEFF